MTSGLKLLTFLNCHQFSGGDLQKIANWYSSQGGAPNGSSTDMQVLYFIKERYPDPGVVATMFKSFEMTRNIISNGSTEKLPDLIVSDSPTYLTTEFPPREVLLKTFDKETPILTLQSLNQIFAWRGTGKTLLSAGLGISLATGTDMLTWQATRPVRVLYCDGEMPDDQIQIRLRNLIGNRKIAPGFFRLVTVGTQANGIPPLSTDSGQQALENVLGDAEVLILDSVSTLAWMATNDEENWLLFLAWMNRLRIQRKLCIIFLHHAGKSGLQRGHSRSEDQLDLSLKLCRDPEDETEWCKFQMTYDKVRGDRTGIRNLNVQFKDGMWSYTTLEADKLAILRKYREENPDVKSARKIAKEIGDELGVRSPKTVGKLIVMLDREKQEKMFKTHGDDDE